MTKAVMQIRPIRTEQDHLEWIEAHMHAAPGSADGEVLDVLATLVDVYESKHHAIDAPTPVAAIQFRIEQQGLSRKHLEPLLGSRSRVSEILAGKRNLTLNMVRRLKSGLGISADLLIEAAPMNKTHNKSGFSVTRKTLTKDTKRVTLRTRKQAIHA
jgi:HTH-type transcriptional regulator/antitoxin HigA